MRSIQSKNGLGHQALLKCKKKKKEIFSLQIKIFCLQIIKFECVCMYHQTLQILKLQYVDTIGIHTYRPHLVPYCLTVVH